MKTNRGLWQAMAGMTVIASLTLTARAERENPYQVIIDKNVFGLKPPPPPPPPAAENTAPPPPPATVKLTGFHSLGPFSKKKALLEITPAPGKQPVKPILEEGERSEGVEVVSIDVEKNSVTINNSGFVTNITFEAIKATASAGAAAAIPGAPGFPGAVPAPAAAPAAVNPSASFNNNNFNSPGGRSSVSVFGAGGGSQNSPGGAFGAAQPNTFPGSIIQNGIPAASIPQANPNVFGASQPAPTDGTGRTIPTRINRSSMANDTGGTAIDLLRAKQQIEAQGRSGPPIPWNPNQ